MKKVCSLLLLAVGMQVVFTAVSSAQSTTLTLKIPPTAVVIDGNAKDWGDTLSFYNPEKKIHYTIANDKDKLYLIVKTKDAVQESNILGAGITFSVDTKGRKRSSFSTTFPSSGENSINTGIQEGNESLADKKQFASVLNFKKIKVDGFKDVSEDYITTNNQYGILVAIDYDDKGYLVYEEAIPLELFHPGDLVKTEWSFNIKLNGIEKTTGSSSPGLGTSPAVSAPSGGGGRGGGRGGSSGGSNKVDPGFNSSQTTRITSSIDFWGKFMLAKTQ